jgi:hypothetical protein
MRTHGSGPPSKVSRGPGQGWKSALVVNDGMEKGRPRCILHRQVGPASALGQDIVTGTEWQAPAFLPYSQLGLHLLLRKPRGS